MLSMDFTPISRLLLSRKIVHEIFLNIDITAVGVSSNFGSADKLFRF